MLAAGMVVVTSQVDEVREGHESIQTLSLDQQPSTVESGDFQFDDLVFMEQLLDLLPISDRFFRRRGFLGFHNRTRPNLDRLRLFVKGP